MFEITLNRSDGIETVLPTIAMAMEAGRICRITNIDYLGAYAQSALALLTNAESLLDSNTGKVFRSQPGFGVIVVDESGFARTLA